MQKWIQRSESIFVALGCLAVFFMIGLTTVDAICRYFFNNPLTGAYEITEKYLMLVGVFLAMSMTYRGGGLIRVTVLMDRLPPGRVKTLINHVSQLLSILYAAVLLVGTYQYATRLFRQGTTLGSIFSLPLWIGAAMIPIGLLFLVIALLVDLPRVRKGGSALFRDQDGPTAT